MAANKKYVVPLVVVTVCAIAAYAAYRLIPRRRTSNGTPASGGAIGGGGTDPYYDQYQQPQQGFDLASLFNGIASLFKGGKSGPTPGAGAAPGGGLLKGSNANAYNVLYDAQHNLNQDGTPISYGSAGTTDTLATSINAQIPLEGLATLDNLPALPLNPITDSQSTDTAALQINPLIPEESTSSSAGDAFNNWWANFTGNPLNQPDTLPSQNINSTDGSAYSTAPDYSGYSGSGFFDNLDNGGSSVGDYSGGSGDYSSYDSGGNYDPNSYSGYGAGDAGNFDSGSYDYSSMDGGGY